MFLDKTTEINLLSIATYLPESAFTTANMLASLGEKLSPSLCKTIQNMGVAQRYSVISNYPEYLLGDSREVTTSTTLMAANAVIKCLSQVDITGESIGLLIAVTNTQSRILPGLAADLIAQLHGLLAPSISHVNMQGQGCSAFLKAVEVAQWYLVANPQQKVLIVVSETPTTYMQQLLAGSYYSFGEVKAMGSNQTDKPLHINATRDAIQALLFGDGAVALLLGKQPNVTVSKSNLSFGNISHWTNEQPEDAELLIMAEGGSAQPFVSGVPHYCMEAGVPARGAAYAVKTVQTILKHSQSKIINLEQANYCFIHTGSRKILDGVCGQFNLPTNLPSVEPSYQVLSKYGNLSSASVGFMFADTPLNLGVGVIVSFGVGFSASAGIFFVY